MTEAINKPEALEDNARKFIVSKIEPGFLKEHGATSYSLSVNWLQTGEDIEKKVAYKKFEDGHIQILFIQKITKDGKRISEKKEITEEEYKKLLISSVSHLEKKRYEFKIVQNGITFGVKYDEFNGGKLYMLEIDAPTESERNSFKPGDFATKLEEVTGDMRYYGYRVIEML